MTSKSPLQLKDNLISGLMVSLIALPLCLGIAMASGFPPVAGLLTAIVGGVLATWLGSAPLTIKGPAAGLIVIALGAVTELGQGDMAVGYRRALAAIVVAAVLQIALALLRAGALEGFFPGSVVHGMLAAIGIIICSKQVHVLLGVKPEAKEPLGLLAEIPRSLAHLNPEIAVIGALALALLLSYPWLKSKAAFFRVVPAPFLVLALAIPAALAFDLDHEHTYTFSFTHQAFHVGPGFLVNLPGNLLSAVTRPDFSQVFSPTSIRYILTFALVGSIESLLSAKAVDMLDPQQRRNDLNKDLLATGVGNLISGMIGGLPMISEIVRSSANIEYGAKGRLSNFFHGLSLLLLVGFASGLLHRIPLAALAAMLIATGVRLASPKEFAKTLRIGPEQLLVFVTTLLVTVGVDLLVGVAAGIMMEMVIHLFNGAPLLSLFRSPVSEEKQGEEVVLRLSRAAVFTNFLALKKRIQQHEAVPRLVVDLQETCLVDHSVMEKLHEIQGDWRRTGRSLEIRGVDDHQSLSAHPLAARKKTIKAQVSA